MAHGLAAPNVFLPRWKSTSSTTCANKPTYSGGSGNNNISKHVITKVHATELRQDTEAAAKSKFDQACDTCYSGILVNGDRVLRQNFTIRSYELDPNGKASLGSMMKRLQVYFGFHVVPVKNMHKIIIIYIKGYQPKLNHVFITTGNDR